MDLGRDLQVQLGTSYVLEHEIGRGGMATVYRAHDVKHRRAVAVKVFAPGSAAELGGERFLREIELCAALHHPNILPLYDSGAVGGTLYFVMPFVDGESLRARLTRETQLPVEETLRLGREVADALAYAHGKGIVHRDVKPENIMLQAGHALLADFGVARATGDRNGRLTVTGGSVGTPAYMSPEQAAADPDVDARSDIYSLGCVVYEMLVGEPPFTGPTPQAMLLQRFTQPPPRASAKRAGLPRGVDDLLRRAMARTPADRFAGAAELAEALDAVLAARQSSGSEHTVSAERSIAVLPFESMGPDPEGQFFADGISEEIINALAQLKGLRVVARTSAFAFKGRTQDLRTVGEQLNVATVLEGSVRRSGNRLRITAQLIDVADGYHLWSERYDRELIDVFAIQDEIATAIAVRLRPSLGRETWDPPKPPTTNLEAYELYLKGRALAYQRGRILLEAVAALERAIALDDRFAHAHAALAEALCFVGYYGLMPLRDVIARAESLAARAVALSPDLAEAQHALGVWGMMYGPDRRAAARALERALALNPYSTPVRCAHAHWRRAVAEQDWELAVSEAAATAAADPLNGFAHAIYSLLLSFAGRYVEAVRVARHAAELDPASTLARLVGQLACGWGGHHDEAAEAARGALALSARNPFPLATFAAECGRAGQSSLAHAILAELSARATYEDVLPSHLALAALAAGRHDEAVAWCHRGVDEGDAHLRTEILNERFVDWRPLRSHPDWPALRAHIATATGAD